MEPSRGGISPAERNRMTQAQEKAINRIRKLVEKECGEAYEVKKWIVSECEYFVDVVVEYGCIGDEGTLAELIARNRAHLFIGKRGGITYYATGKRNGLSKRTFHGYSILEAVEHWHTERKKKHEGLHQDQDARRDSVLYGTV